MFSLKHPFNSPQADGVDPTLVKPSDWNAEHTVVASKDGVFIGRAAGAGPGAMQELDFSSLLPAGTIIAYAGPVSPAGWLPCAGGIYNIADYNALFNVIGARYGGNGTTTFAVPDLLGRVIAGPDAGSGRLTQIPGPIGSSGGGQIQAATVFGNVTVSPTPANPLTGHVNLPSASAGAGSGAGDRFASVDSGVTIDGGVANGLITNDGGITNHTGSFSIVQPTFILNFLIKT